MAFVFDVGSIAAKATVRRAGVILIEFRRFVRAAACVLEKAKLYIMVLVSLMRRRASSSVVVLS